MSEAADKLRAMLDDFEHECFMLRVEASETRAKDDVVRKSYERIRNEFAARIAATLGSGTCKFAEGGVVSGNYIRSEEEGSLCLIPNASVTFEGQKLTLDAEDSERLSKLIKGHFRKLAGLGDAQ